MNQLKYFTFFVLAVLFIFPLKVNASLGCLDYGMAYEDFDGYCKCMSGYIWDKNILGQPYCVSCSTKYGYGATSDFSGGCKCMSGYVMGKNFLGEPYCISGDTYCSDKHGYHSSYNSLAQACECDSGYTFGDNGQCVEKQNNVYFYLKELDTDNKQAIIRSNYDYAYYLITYGSGCYSFSFDNYLHDNIVVNLGTDFDVDRYDKIVLYDDDEVCDIVVGL